MRLAHRVAQQVKTVVSLPACAGLPIAHSPGRGAEHNPSAGEHANGKCVLRIAEEASLSKWSLEWNVLWYRLVFDSWKLPTALLSIRLVVNKPGLQKCLLLKRNVLNSICKCSTVVDNICRWSLPAGGDNSFFAYCNTSYALIRTFRESCV